MVYAEVRTLFGLRMRQAGLVYAIGDHSIVGQVVQGRRTSKGWSEIKILSAKDSFKNNFVTLPHKVRFSGSPGDSVRFQHETRTRRTAIQ